jgi:hypothetical protein
VPVVFWILLGVVVAAAYATVLTLLLVRYTRRRRATTPYRLPATVQRARAPDGERLELDLGVAWPGEPVDTTTVAERTTGRRFVPAFTDGMAVSVFSPPDRSWYRLDWSQFDELTLDQKGAHAFVPKRSRSAAAKESSDWQVTCKTCGFTRSVWAVGGVRFGARGESNQGLDCPICGRLRMHRVWRPRTPEPPAVPIVAD